MAYQIIHEKEKKIREGMSIMGMKDSSFYLSWIAYYLIVYLILALLISLVLKTSVFK